LLAVVGFILWVSVSTNKAKKKRLNDSWAAYQAALAMLKQDPANPDLRGQTLALGRAYCEVARSQQSKGSVTLFDEVALSNDINAACAGAGATKAPEATAPKSAETRLQELAALRERGTISEEEYRAARAKVLGEV